MGNKTFPQPGCKTCPYEKGENYFNYSSDEEVKEAMANGTYRFSTQKVCTFAAGPGTSIYCSGTLSAEDRYLISIGG